MPYAAMPFSRPMCCSPLAFAATASSLPLKPYPYGLQEGNAERPRLSCPYRHTVVTGGGSESGTEGPRGSQPFSAAAMDSAIGVVGRPVSRDRSPVVTASSPFAMDPSTPARIAARASGSPAPVRMPV